MSSKSSIITQTADRRPQTADRRPQTADRRPQTADRDCIVDSLRGFAIITVVLGHVCLAFINSGLIFSGMSQIRTAVYSFHMPLMFMISGYVHGMKDHFSGSENFSGYLKKYLAELYLPAMYFSVTYWLLKYFLISPSNNAEGFNLVSVKDFCMIPILGFNEYWFLCTLFFVKAVHVLLEYVFRHKYMISLFWLLLFILINIFSSSLPVFLSRFSFGFCFHIGYLLRTKSLISPKQHPRLLYGLILLASGVILYCLGSPKSAVSLTLSLSMFIIFYAAGITNSFLVRCGVYSMIIYCLHVYVITLTRLIYRFAGLTESISPAVLFVITSAAGVVLPLFVVMLYQNVKALGWIEYIFFPGKLLKKHRA